jgi:hypothetical protein
MQQLQSGVRRLDHGKKGHLVFSLELSIILGSIAAAKGAQRKEKRGERNEALHDEAGEAASKITSVQQRRLEAAEEIKRERERDSF